jgi:hypothetical protein
MIAVACIPTFVSLIFIARQLRSHQVPRAPIDRLAGGAGYDHRHNIHMALM